MDNFSITQGSGTIIATDQVADNSHIQKIKLIDPTPDSTTGIGISSNPMRTDPTGTTAQPVTGTFFQATQPISASSLPLPTGASTEATLALIKAKTDNIDVLLSTRTKPADSQIVTQTTGSNLKTQTTISDESGKLIGAAKTLFSLRATNFTAATTEAMVTCTPSRDGVDGATGTSFTVTAGKRLVLLGMTVLTKNAAAGGQGVVCRIRINPSGAVVVTSPILSSLGAGSTLATTNAVGCTSVNLSQGYPGLLEITGTFQVGISQIGTATAGNDVVIWGYEY